MRYHPAVIPVLLWDGTRDLQQVHSVRHDRTLAALRRVAAARLRRIQIDHGQAEADKQETPGVPAPKVSTAHTLWSQEARAASAQSDTRGA